MTRFLAGLLAGLFVGIGYTAFSQIRVEALGGNCSYGKVGNTIWYQEQYPTELHMQDGCVFVGLSSVDRNQGTLHFGWRVGYTDLGAARAFGVYSYHDSEAHLNLDGLSCDSATKHGCLAKGFGVQTAKGFTLGGVAEWDTIIRGLTVGAELGGFLYEGRWTVIVDQYPNATDIPQMYADWKGWQVTPFLGLTARMSLWGRTELTAMARNYARVKANEHNCGGCSGVANRSASQFLLGLSYQIK